MAVAAREQNEPERRQTYKDLLDRSVGPLVSFNKTSSFQAIEEKLQGLKPAEIRKVLRDRRARLRKMIDYIDIEVGPCDLESGFLSEMTADFNKQIHIVINNIPKPDNYIGNQQGMSDEFKLVGPAVAKAVAALKTRDNASGAVNLEPTEEARFKLIQGVIQKSSDAYERLLEATEHLEAGLRYWDKPGEQPEAEAVDIQAYISELISRLQQQRKTARVIYDELLYKDVDEPFGKPALVEFERQLREEILATLVSILQPSMRNDEALQKPLADTALGAYDAYKIAIIRSLRKAKNALNLALDEYKYITPPLILTSEHLEGMCQN